MLSLNTVYMYNDAIQWLSFQKAELHKESLLFTVSVPVGK